MDVRFYVDRSTGQFVRGSIEEIPTDPDRLIIRFRYNAKMVEEIKSFDGARWNPADKYWTIYNNARNLFQLDYLTGGNPYKRYDTPLVPINKVREATRSHQLEFESFFLTRKRCILGGEMGVGKTLAVINHMERVGGNWLWVAPRGALASARLEFANWQSKIQPYAYTTYESSKKFTLDERIDHIVLDEFHKIKNPASGRSQDIAKICNYIRLRDGYILLLSGTPAPEDPTDWYNAAELACPGFIKEGNLMKFKKRLCKIEYYEGLGGQSYPKLVTWWDDERKCGICGQLKDHYDHSDTNLDSHPWVPSVNEVAALYERLQGLVLIKWLKDCVDLPPKQYKIIRVEPSEETLRVASLIQKSAPSVIKALTLLRELSDGFQYVEEKDGFKTCPTCAGRGIETIKVDADDPDNPLDSESLSRGHRVLWDEEGLEIVGQKEEPLRLEDLEVTCSQCAGDGEITKYSRGTSHFSGSPKDEVLKDLLDEYSDATPPRVVIAAGFQGSIEHVTKLCLEDGWVVIRLDGRGYWCSQPGVGKAEDMLRYFQDRSNHKKIAWVLQPGAGGMGITLTESKVIIYYSNTFVANDRTQSEARIYRIGSNGAMIIDLFHLPTDEYVYNKVMAKQDLMRLSMGELQSALNTYKKREEPSL